MKSGNKDKQQAKKQSLQRVKQQKEKYNKQHLSYTLLREE